jgi:hypothetical protein
MANFQVDPRPFLVVGLAVEHGWNHPAQRRMALGGEPTREHEDFAIVTINPPPKRQRSFVLSSIWYASPSSTHTVCPHS